jgi:hypothetical protein
VQTITVSKYKEQMVCTQTPRAVMVKSRNYETEDDADDVPVQNVLRTHRVKVAKYTQIGAAPRQKFKNDSKLFSVVYLDQNEVKTTTQIDEAS